MNEAHPSQRGWFAAALAAQMAQDERVWLLTSDLGYGMLDVIRDAFPRRFVNVGTCEQALIGIACGLAYRGLKPFCYSITPFLLCRPFEWHRNFVNHERIPVRLVGSGLDDDYERDGFTHHAFDARAILGLFPNVRTYWPETKEQVPDIVRAMCERDEPAFIALRR